MSIGIRNRNGRQLLLRTHSQNAEKRIPQLGDLYHRDEVSIHFNRAEDLYAAWPTPTCIISDGPYGVSGFPGDEHRAEGLVEWYRLHVPRLVCSLNRADDSMVLGD